MLSGNAVTEIWWVAVASGRGHSWPGRNFAQVRRSYTELAFFRVISGIGGSVFIAVGTAAVVVWFRDKDVTLALGITGGAAFNAFHRGHERLDGLADHAGGPPGQMMTGPSTVWRRASGRAQASRRAVSMGTTASPGSARTSTGTRMDGRPDTRPSSSPSRARCCCPAMGCRQATCWPQAGPR